MRWRTTRPGRSLRSQSTLTPPTVTSTSPLNGVSGVSGTADVTATFSEALDPASITGSTFELRDAGNALVAAVVTYNAATRVATLNPTPTLSAGVTYTATIKGGATGVKDVAGNALAANLTWIFTIAADTTPPTVTAFTPGSGATGVATTSVVTATFSEAMNAGTISGTTFVLSNGAAQVAASVSYNPSTRVATLTPSAELASGTLHTATVIGGGAGVKDAAGNALATNRTWSFTTAGADLTPPSVTLTSPSNGATGVLGTANVTATFSEAMDATTINSTTFELRDPANNLVPAAVTYSAATRVVTLNPTPTLTPLTTYTATIKGGATDPRVKDAAGNALPRTSRGRSRSRRIPRRPLSRRPRLPTARPGSARRRTSPPPSTRRWTLSTHWHEHLRVARSCEHRGARGR